MPIDETFYEDNRKDKSKIVAVRVILEGRVQKVGLRNWIKQRAARLNIDGWARNKGSDAVEAMFFGSENDVNEMIKLCYQGTSFAYIRKIREFPQADLEGIPRGFSLLTGA
ncbi:acylphosphatase [Rickettsiales bacterium]|nr:acylphosphatase [Rickettsiales bacterium]